MAHANPGDDAIRTMLKDAKRIAMVGASSDPQRPSNGVMRRLLSAGYDVIPVNPHETTVHGKKAVATLAEAAAAGPIDIVDVFRRPEFTPDVARDAVKIGAKALWLQLGVINDEAAAIAKGGGLDVVMDLCIAVELALLRPR